MNYNAHGDLVGLKRGNQPLTEYSYNRWGAVASMTVGNGQPLQVFGSGDSATVNLPGGVTADVDTEGRLSQVTYPGLATKEYGFDGLGRTTRVTIGGVLLRRYQYGQGRLEQITAGEPGSEEVYVYGYDAEGRLTSLTRDGVAWGSWTYPDLADLRQQEGLADPNRVQRYTDPNGVTQSYGYEDGQVTLIDIAQGPSFQMAYDAGGNQTQIRAMGMEARFTEWVNGMPTRIAWGDGTTFDLSQDDKGQLDSIAESGGVFLLDLDWEDVPREGLCSEAGEAGPPDKKISKVTRKAPGLEETWEPTYTEAQQLQSIQITRTGGQDTDTLTESYGEVRNQLLGGLTRVLNGTVVRDDALTHDATADHRRVGSVAGTGGVDVYSYDPVLGNLTRIDDRDGRVREFAWDGFRRLTEIREDGQVLGAYAYDHQNRRIRAAIPASDVPLAFAWHGSRVIAIGQQRGTAEAPRVSWTHAIGQGPLGPAFLKDLTGGGHDYYIATDHLGTPYAYKHVASGTVYLSPLTPWGERVQSPSLGAQAGVVPDSVFASAPLGLGGHLMDWETGLTQMHHRYYDAKLGHFLNPDFREPNLYDPTTVKEPYAYAAGNPILFWDPDGLAEEPGRGPQSPPGSRDFLLYYLRYALFWKSSHSERFYEAREKATQAIAAAQTATLTKKDQVIASLEENQIEGMEPGFERLSAATDFYGDRALLWVLGAGHGGLNFGENSVATASMAHNALLLGVDRFGIVDPSLSRQASDELAPIVSVFEEKGAIPVIVEGAAQPVVKFGSNMILAQEGDFQAEFDLVAGGTELGLALAPMVLLGPEASGAGVLPRSANLSLRSALFNAKTGRFVLHQAIRDAKAFKLTQGRKFRQWILQGIENDKYYWNLGRAERGFYMRGQKTFSGKFWRKNEAKLDGFTVGKSGELYVLGVVERGKWLKANYPVRSSSINLIDFAAGIRTTIGTGPDPASRQILMFLFRVKP
ncbi:RHS repeat-associated core domain-containing protein [Sulfidibacter corallicola]|uniref:RHS repeat-associated core domain-containing protein n=1 Tax=Sulfidibacter corallicola TaxID=2818388 RepID=A0A8A4TJ85_SULCO|nr:RHS repeat-associated core domain-containing protein [Sulfidibacter corallicola]QTD48911.1 RHS repeat-associated core domain-containing protein [Sulfidibacter corallicola]